MLNPKYFYINEIVQSDFFTWSLLPIFECQANMDCLLYSKKIAITFDL
jgi:hypothetical protein